MSDQGEGSARLVDMLMAGDQDGIFQYGGKIQQGTLYAITTKSGETRAYDTAGTWAWYRGFEIGQSTASTRPIRKSSRRPLGQIRGVLVAPTIDDACRIAIRAIMEQAGVGVQELAARTHRTRKAVGDALRYGRPTALSMTVAEMMMRACGGVWDISYTRPGNGKVDDEITPPADVTRPEPAGLTRARALAVFHERGLIAWTAPLDPNAAQRAAWFTVERAGVAHQIRAEVVVPWLAGLADATDPIAASCLK